MWCFTVLFPQPLAANQLSYLLLPKLLYSPIPDARNYCQSYILCWQFSKHVKSWNFAKWVQILCFQVKKQNLYRNRKILCTYIYKEHFGNFPYILFFSAFLFTTSGFSTTSESILIIIRKWVLLIAKSLDLLKSGKGFIY